VLENFVDSLGTTVSDAHLVERILAGEETLTIDALSNQPEEWTEGNLIWPLLEAVGLNREPGRPASQRSAAGTTQREAPDFRLVERGGEFVVIGRTSLRIRSTELNRSSLATISQTRPGPTTGSLLMDSSGWSTVPSTEVTSLNSVR